MMDVEENSTHIEEVPADNINRKNGLKTIIQKLLTSNQCKNTALGQSCASKNCKVVLYYNRKEINHENINDVAGFVTVTKTGSNSAEIFNLCTAAPHTTQELLKYIVSYYPDINYWIGLKLESKKFDENVKIFASFGFSNPVITKTSPSGIDLDYEFIAFIRKEGTTITKDLYETTINSATSLKNTFFAPKETVEKIKFKTFPQYYKPHMRVDTESKLKTTDDVRPASPKKTKQVKEPQKEKQKEKQIVTAPPKHQKIDIKHINPRKLDNERKLYRRDKTSVFVQMDCLNGYLPKGRLVNDAELSGKTAEEVIKIIKEAGYIHEGTYGLVYQACDADNDCNYVVKIQIIESEEQHREWKKEVELMIKFNEYNIGPRIRSAWLCNDNRAYGIFIAEKWDGNLGDGDINVCPSKELIDKFEGQIKTIHKLGYVHGDIMPKNVLVKKDENGSIIDLTITDFGTVDTPSEWKRREISEGWITIFYNYHITFGSKISTGFLWPYYKSSFIALEDVKRDPALMDNDLLYYLRSKC